jgi:YidC/Oxa1 family membrane protein insertase
LAWLQDILTKTLDFFYALVPNYGVAIIFLTVILKALLYWPQQQSLMSSLKMQKMTPEMQEIQKKFKNDPDQLNKAMSQLYKKHGINPAGCFTSSCLLQIPQLIIMWALWFAIQAYFLMPLAPAPIDVATSYGLTMSTTTPTNPFLLYHTYTTTVVNGTTMAQFVRGATPGAWFLGFNLAYLPTQGGWHYYLWPILVALTMYLQSYTMGSSRQQGGTLMMILFPLLIGWISLSIPIAVSLYWVMFSLLQIAQQLIVFKGIPLRPQALAVKTQESKKDK